MLNILGSVVLGGVKRLWHAWNLRGCILLSLLLQVSLFSLAPFRTRWKEKIVHSGVWVAYLLCDWIAAVAIGIISKGKGDGIVAPHDASEGFMAFWASFLLMHLGGPDTITAFALEDNQFWLRHLSGLVFQLVSTVYIFYQTFPQNVKLLIPTLTVFVAGAIKYAERTRALYLASLGQFGRSVLPKPNPGPDYEEAVTIHSSLHLIKVPSQPEVMPTPDVALAKDSKCTGENKELEPDIKLLQEAHRLFRSFKGLIVGHLLSSKDRELSRQYFLTRKANEAFRLIEYELNFMYDLLHTKVVVVRSHLGYSCRFISFSSILVALMVFRSIEKQHEFDNKFDIKISYALLMGALGLEAVALLMLIFSDWTLIARKLSWGKFIAKIILRRQRWSRSFYGYDMISYCLKGLPEWLSRWAANVRLEGVPDKINISVFSQKYLVSEDLENFIFDQLRMKSLTANNLKAAMDACSQRGEWALMHTSSCFKLKWSVDQYQYAESLLLWHLATELCYAEEKKPELSCCLKTRKKEKTPKSSRPDYIKICKHLSDYMFYLIVMQTPVMAPVLGNWQIAFQDTCAEAKKFFRQKGIKKRQYRIEWQDRVEACKKVLGVDISKFRPVAVKGSKSKSVFFDACILAKQLLNLNSTVDRWMVMSRVWVELMSYAAIKCIPIVHAQQPSRGGELLTFVWLLMNHLGLGTQFYEHERQTRTKMVDLVGDKVTQTEENKQEKQDAQLLPMHIHSDSFQN